MAAIAGIEVKAYKGLETSRGIAYSAQIWLDGAEVGSIENRGDGGETFIDITDQNVRIELERRISAYFELNPATLNDKEDFFNEIIELNTAEKNFRKSVLAKGMGLVIVAFGYERTKPLDALGLEDLSTKHYYLPTDRMLPHFEKDKKPVRYLTFSKLDDFYIYPELIKEGA